MFRPITSAAASVFLERQAKEIGLQFRQWTGVPGKPVTIMTLPGEDPSLPSLCLNSHVDVVPVDEDHWDYPPFSATKVDGKIYARGTQDMKCVGMQYLEALRVLKERGIKLKRTIHLTFVPDEEIGGHDGMEIFVKDPLFKELNIGCALDEGLASESDKFTVFYGERVAWWVTIQSEGPPGHGSRFVKDTATIKLNKVINRFLEFRRQQEAILEGDPTKKLGDVTTVNLTILRGGVQCNVIPSEAECSFDIRLPPTVNLEEFQKQIDEWTKEEVSTAAAWMIWDVRVKLNSRSPCHSLPATLVASRYCHVANSMFFATPRYIRATGVPAIGFSPMNNTPVLLHDHNEFLHEDIYLRGIDIYCEILPALANDTVAK
ncbi:aminoacylase-1 [Salpingoeca rosetta]|uniref:N-acyl-aliphatic-L-amino acid amidohydrolase n=1 Tax=Salpingoeca rosetta (strain ATCC 50818 / BSB-021) TaxID=946362 RepID=F2TZ54_SALR5|nr:aminoacylase-1 [Salpingoeca rosetta]EGD78878.1 aminoacylase-1 [Salpingoeca rosetta]|eukprot:XP_004997834.1 aminoacylase-1 [Salpingoeca rosetta]